MLICDFRRLNAESVDQTYPVASIQEDLNSLAKNSMYSTIDCQNAIMSIEMDEDS